jgi:probable rRNA maturation factor
MGDDDPGGGLRVLISNRQTLPLDEDGLNVLAIETLAGEGVGRAELSVSFVEDREIENLHGRFANQEGPTDVLSFPLGDAGDDGITLLGDVVIAPGVAARNNPGDPDGELRLLLVHGILHLLGFDHEAEDEKAEMWSRQERYSGVASP